MLAAGRGTANRHGLLRPLWQVQLLLRSAGQSLFEGISPTLLPPHHTTPLPRYQLLPLHSMVAPAEQRRVFVRPPAGVRKIVLATNIGACG